MSVKEVTLLRKSGNLKEAYKMAIDDLKEDRNNPWAQMSLFWVLRDICQQLCNRNAIDKAKICLKEMSSLLPTMVDDSGAGERAYTNLYKRLQPNADAISKASELSKNDPSNAYVQVKNYIDSANDVDSALHEELGWIIYRYIKAKISNLTSLEIRTLLKDYMYLRNERPSMLHSQILNFALSFSKEHSDFSFYRFFMLWEPENLRYEDLNKGYYNGSEIPSLISRICRQIVNSGEDIDVEMLCEKINLPKTETLDLLREPQFWEIMNLHKEGKMREMFEAFTVYNKRNAVYGASHWHSEVLKIAERHMNGQETWRFIYFFRDWRYENLMDADWKEETDNNGNTYKPLAVKAAKKCYEYLKESHPRDAELVSWLDSLYNVLIERAKKDEWILRQRAIIYTWQQQYDLAINVYKSLLLEMSEKYYVWSELADCIQDSNELKIALLSKALLVEKVNKETALPNFNSGIVVVDDINIQKKLFHYTFGQGKIGGIVFFNDTDLRPEVGQCLKIFYCVTKDRKGEKRPIVLNVEETAEINTSAIKTIQGHLELKYKNGSWDDSPDFAFIGDYYVHHSVLCEYNITKDCYVTADVIYAGQGKWKVIKIHQ